MPETSLLRGTFVDLVTPFCDGELDRTGLSLLVEWQIQSGIEGLVVCGEAGEPHCLSDEERQAVISAAVEGARRRVPVLVGILANSTDTAIRLVRQAERLKADGVVVALPYYNKPTADGALQHLASVTQATALPVLVLSRPSTTMLPLQVAFARRIAALPNVAGLIHCAPDPASLLALTSCPEIGRPIFGGDEHGNLAGLFGAAGCLSLVANVAPRMAVSRHHAAAGGNPKAAHALERRLQPLLDVMGRDHPVSTLKQALAFVFGTSPQVRLPLVPMETENLQALRTALSLVGLATDLPFLSAVAAATQGGLRCRL